MRKYSLPSFPVLFFLASFANLSIAQSSDWLSTLSQPHNYVQKRASSFDRSGGNADFRVIPPGETLTVLDESGPANITHIWFTLADDEPHHLKKIVLRIFWDEEPTPSVETPLGDFFGLGLGEYFTFQSALLAVAPNRALNSFFPMPFQKHARITITNSGNSKVDAFYFNIDYQLLDKPLPPGTLYFHAQYRQATPAKGLTSPWIDNGDPAMNDIKNLRGEGNYVWMETTGRGQYMGVTMSILQNQDFWWGEGDDMFFIDGATEPSISGTGSEDYFLGAYGFGGSPFSYALFGAPVVGQELAGSRTSVYRFHLDSPIPFTKSFKATIEHGHANSRSDNYFSVAYWYQSEPHAAFPSLPSIEDRLPRLHAVGGPGNSAN
ncbi:MAG TPA: glycoside hydrolase family 172 protein [Candidatus Acidoferrum sp.]|nr:glycoside hydrolase family 172 protein [Candidatus Acidoferrum sp.]